VEKLEKMQRTTIALLCLVLGGGARCLAAQGAAKVCDPRDFGAVADGKTKDTAALQRAIEECAAAGGGIVRLRAGIFLTAPITLRSRITLQLDAGATLLGSADAADYQPAGPEASKTNSLLPLVRAINEVDVAIAGEGAIDGSGRGWWEAARAARDAGQPLPVRPRLVVFTRCRRVRVEGVTLRNSPSFHLVPSQCEDVTIRGIRIFAPPDSPNTDGIDPMASRNVRISECTIDTGDDNIAIKSGAIDPNHPEAAAADITITDCTFLHGHALSIGSETNGGVRNITAKRCTFKDTQNGLRIKSYRGRGGNVEAVSYSDMKMENVSPAITFSGYYPNIPEEDEAQPPAQTTPRYHAITITNLTATGGKVAGQIIGLPESPITDLLLENVSISAASGMVMRNAVVRTKNLKVSVKSGPPLVIQNNVRVTELLPPQ
jgi:polygalacturonase